MIYSVTASAPGCRIGGWRVKAESMQDATAQAMRQLPPHGSGWNVNIVELKNQTAALAKWEKENS